jgi:hypothetical protein
MLAARYHQKLQKPIRRWPQGPALVILFRRGGAMEVVVTLYVLRPPRHQLPTKKIEGTPTAAI